MMIIKLFWYYYIIVYYIFTAMYMYMYHSCKLRSEIKWFKKNNKCSCYTEPNLYNIAPTKADRMAKMAMLALWKPWAMSVSIWCFWWWRVRNDGKSSTVNRLSFVSLLYTTLVMFDEVPECVKFVTCNEYVRDLLQLKGWVSSAL